MPPNMNNAPDDILRLIFEQRSSIAKRHTRDICTPLTDYSFMADDRELEENSSLILASLNKRCRAIALTTSQLWSTLRDEMIPERYLSFLQRSGQTPLTIVIRRLYPKEGVEARQDRFLHTVLAKRDQWCTLYVATRGHVGKERFRFAEEIVTDFPILSSVSITDGRGPDSFSKKFKMDSHNFIQDWLAPVLKTAFFHGILPNGPFLSSLKSLEVELHGGCSPPRDIWSRLSSRCSLQRLSISLEDWDYPDETPPEQPVTLDSVESFNLRVSSTLYSAAFWVLHAFRCPRLRSLSISLHEASGGRPEEWYRAISNFLEGGVGRGDGLEEIFINFGDDLAPSPDGLSIIECFFGRSAGWSPNCLSCLTVGQRTLQNLGSHRRRQARPVMVALAQFPPTMSVLDITRIFEVDAIALNELIKRLCEANSRASLRVEEKSIRYKKESNAFAVKFVRSFCKRQEKDGHMNFQVTWLRRR